jgi:carboxymethylenebutenolidase
MGRTDSVLAWCDRLAASGFAAVALDFYDGKTAATMAAARQLRDSANKRAELSKALVHNAWAAMREDGRIQTTKPFLMGWSFGGAWATYSGSFLSDAAGIIAFYGESFTDNASLYDSVQAPILFIGAEQDVDPSPETFRRIVQELTLKDKKSSLLLLPAGHGFAERNHPGYDPDATEKSWDAVLRFLNANAP